MPLVLGLLLSAFAFWSAPACALEVPPYRGYVNDYADLLSPATEARLEQALQSFALSDSTQIAVLTIPSLEGEDVEGFSIRTVEGWKIGQKGKDNGVLFLVVKNDRKMRIEVGRGLEGVLTDLASGRIIDTVVAPRFRAGRFDEGVEAGVVAIVQTTRGEFKGEPGGRPPRRRGEPSPLFTYLFFGIAIITFLGNVSKRLGVAAGSILLPLAGLFGFASAPGLVVLLLLAVGGALGGLLLPLIFGGMLRGGGGFYLGGGGFGSGGYGGGGGFGGFGGGGFGGGGASGSW